MTTKARAIEVANGNKDKIIITQPEVKADTNMLVAIIESGADPVMCIGWQGSPAIMGITGAPADPGRAPEGAGSPDPAIITIPVPATVVKGCPAPGIGGMPDPAMVAIDPAAPIAIGSPAGIIPGNSRLPYPVPSQKDPGPIGEQGVVEKGDIDRVRWGYHH